jgi:hypothetical protein
METRCRETVSELMARIVLKILATVERIRASRQVAGGSLQNTSPAIRCTRRHKSSLPRPFRDLSEIPTVGKMLQQMTRRTSQL